MTLYFAQVFAVSALLGLLSAVSFDKNNKVYRFAFSVLLLYVVILPLGDISVEDFELDNITSDYEDVGEYEEVARDAFVSGIRRLVSDKYSLKEENVRVLIEGFDFQNMKAEKIRIILSGGAVFSDYKSIERYINETNIGECTVEIEIG